MKVRQYTEPETFQNYSEEEKEQLKAKIIEEIKNHCERHPKGGSKFKGEPLKLQSRSAAEVVTAALAKKFSNKNIELGCLGCNTVSKFRYHLRKRYSKNGRGLICGPMKAFITEVKEELNHL